MSLNLNANNNHAQIIFPDPADIKLVDVLLACVFLTLCISSIAALHYLFPTPVKKPIISTTINLISIADIKNTEPMAAKKYPTPNIIKKVKKQEQFLPKKTIKAVPKPRQQAKPKPKAQPKPKAKPKPKPKPKPKAQPKPDDNYDPFAPLVSNSNVHHANESYNNREKSTKKPAQQIASNAELQTSLRKQLTDAELKRYIVMMQRAVQKHWKVPAGVNDASRDPVVIMNLKRNGNIASVQIASSSGSKTLDESLIRAINAAAPFTLPQQQFNIFRSNRIKFHPLL
ncbi:MAG: TonB family protein [Mariprofundales bacterium]